MDASRQRDWDRADPRLLVVTESLGVGGTESHLLRTLPLLARKGFSVSVFCLTERGERAREAEAAGIEVIAAPSLAKIGRAHV